MIVFIQRVVETTNQRQDGTIFRRHGDEAGLNLGQLTELPDALVILDDTYDGARA